MIDRAAELLGRGLKSLAASPGFLLGSVLILGITAGGLVASASVAWQVIFKPQVYEQPEQLVSLSARSTELGWRLSLSPAMAEELRQADWIQSIASYRLGVDLSLPEGQRLRSAEIDPALLPLLGVRATHGRVFEPGDADPAATPVALLSERAWQSRFSGDPAAIGRSMELAGETVRIVGVLPNSFTLPDPGVELWRPLVFAPELLEFAALNKLGNADFVIARLAPGISPGAAGDALEATYADDPRLGLMREALGLVFQAEDARQAWVGDQDRPVYLLLTATTAVFLIATLNLAGLWMARWLARRNNLAIRSALGAGRWEAVQASAMEFALVAAFGTLLGLGLAHLGIHWLVGMDVLETGSPLVIGIGAAGHVIALMVAVLAAVPVLLAIAWQTRNLESSAGAMLTGEGYRVHGAGLATRRALIVVQIAMATALLSSSGLLLISWNNLIAEDLGFESGQLLVAHIRPDPSVSTDSAGDPLVAAGMERVVGVAGVSDVAFANAAPFGRVEIVSSFHPPDRPDSEAPMRQRLVSANYFETAGIAVLAGQIPDAIMAAGPPTRLVVDEVFARRHFSGQTAIGGQFRYGTGPSGETEMAEVAAVVTTTRHMAPDENVELPSAYFIEPEPEPHYQLLVRTALQPAQMLVPVRTALEQELGPDRVGMVSTVSSLVERTIADRRPQLFLLGLFTALAVGLAAVGLFALLSYSARARVPELGLRLALGAPPTRAAGMILGDGMKLLVMGLIPGIALGVTGSQLLSERLYQVGPWQPTLWLAVIALMALVVAVAGLRPALQSMHVEPMDALRQE